MNMAQVRSTNQDPRDTACCSADCKGPRLQTRVRLLVTAIVCAYTLFGLALFASTAGGPGAGQAKASMPAAAVAADQTAKARWLNPQRSNWIWAGWMLGAASLAASFVYTRKLLAPLDEVRRTAARVACGRLDRPADVRREDETGTLAGLINDIAANQQEILLHLWNQTGNSLQAIERIHADIGRQFPNDGLARIKADLSSVRTNMENLRALTDGVAFFQVQLRNRTVTAATDRRETERREADPPALVGSGFCGHRGSEPGIES